MLQFLFPKNLDSSIGKCFCIKQTWHAKSARWKLQFASLSNFSRVKKLSKYCVMNMGHILNSLYIWRWFMQSQAEQKLFLRIRYIVVISTLYVFFLSCNNKLNSTFGSNLFQNCRYYCDKISSIYLYYKWLRVKDLCSSFSIYKSSSITSFPEAIKILLYHGIVFSVHAAVPVRQLYTPCLSEREIAENSWQ